MKRLIAIVVTIIPMFCFAQNPDQRTSLEFKWHQEFARQNYKESQIAYKNNPLILSAKMIIPKSDMLSMILAGGYSHQKVKQYLSGHFVENDQPWTASYFEIGFKIYIGVRK